MQQRLSAMERKIAKLDEKLQKHPGLEAEVM